MSTHRAEELLLRRAIPPPHQSGRCGRAGKRHHQVRIVVVGSQIDIGDLDVELAGDDGVPGLLIGNQAPQVATSAKTVSVLLLFFPLMRANCAQARLVAGGPGGDVVC
jgi:hypothetical protein